MNVSNIIVDFANANKEFKTNDLSEYLSGKIELSKKMLSWHLRKLLNEKKIFRISKGVYTTTQKAIFLFIDAQEIEQRSVYNNP